MTQTKHDDEGKPCATKPTSGKQDNPKTDQLQRKKKRQKIDKLRRQLQSMEAVHSQGSEESKHIGDGISEKAYADSAVLEMIQSASISGSLAQKVCKQLHQFSSDFLEFIMLEQLPSTSWKRVVDLVHANPQKDFHVAHFMANLHGEPIPKDCFISVMRQFIKDAAIENIATKFIDIAQRFPQVYQSYNFLRSKAGIIKPPRVVEILAYNIRLETLIWYFEELYERSSNCYSILKERLQKVDAMTVNCGSASSSSKVCSYGKLMERMLVFQRRNMTDIVDGLMPIARRQLSLLKEVWHDKVGSQKVAVFGDASASMQCDIEAGAIFSCMSSVCLDGELSFFRTNLVESPYQKPQTVEETLEVCKTIQADGLTCPGACLLPYLESKIWLDTIVLVTDEEENLGIIPGGDLENMKWITITTEDGEQLQVVQSDGFLFNHHLKDYMDTVNPKVQLVIVCIGSGNPTFHHNLTQQGIVPQIKTIDGKHLDLAKFDTLLGQLAS